MWGLGERCCEGVCHSILFANPGCRKSEIELSFAQHEKLFPVL
jgi:hypothetical protein